MTKLNDGGPALPTTETVQIIDKGPGDYRDMTISYGGMSLWDYFAAHAPIMRSFYLANQGSPEGDAKMCADFADAMIAEREKRFKEE